MLIQPYNPEWKQRFEAIKEVLLAAASNPILDIQYVGSTAVPHLAAKDIIDIDIIYEGEEKFALLCEKLANVSYYHKGNQGIPHREVFKRSKEGESHPLLDSIKHHLYACPKDSPELRRHLLFREYLRMHPLAREEYEAIKYRIAKEAHQNKKEYAQIKEKAARNFVESILKKATR